MEERSEEAEKEACLTLKDLERILVRYIVDNYNQRIDARMGDQTRTQRWESGSIANPDVLSERELDICLMKLLKRSIQRGGYLQFAHVWYRGENMGGYAGENVIVCYDPRDITTILLYQQESGKESFLARAHAIDFETEHLSFDEARAISRKIRKVGKALNNSSILAEIQDRDTFVNTKKTKKERQKEKQKALAKIIEPLQPADAEEEAEETITTLQVPMSEVQVFDYEQLMEDYGF